LLLKKDVFFKKGCFKNKDLQLDYSIILLHNNLEVLIVAVIKNTLSVISGFIAFKDAVLITEAAMSKTRLT
jgi:hypothetical protein